MAVVILRTVIVFFTLIIAMRIMGKRQMGELELPELAVAVLIADLGAHPLQDIGIPLMNGLLPVIVLFCCQILLAGLNMRFVGLRKIIYGTPCFLIENGVINQKEMRRNRFTLEELAEELRSREVCDIKQIQYAILETNGLLNVLLYPSHKPPSAKELDIPVRDPGYYHIIINNGKLMQDNLKKSGKDLDWLMSELQEQGVSDPSKVFLLSLNDEGGIFYAAMENVK